MKHHLFDPKKGMEFGLYTLGDHLPDPLTGRRVSAEQRLRDIIDYAKLADEAGIDFFSVGESHQQYFATQAHAVVLAAIAAATKRIRIGSSSTIISTSDPVRVYENFATVDLIAGGRAEIICGRASRVGLFNLLGYDLRDYEELFEEKFNLLLQINEKEAIDWSGKFRAPLHHATILPRPARGKLPIWRAVGGSSASAVKAGYAGVPMFMAHLGGPAAVFKSTIDAYREAARQSGYDPEQLPVATAGFFYTADTVQEALRQLYPRINEGMKRTNGQGFSKQLFAQGADPHSIINVGSPEAIVEKLLYQHELFGNCRYIAQIDFGGMPAKQVMKNIEVIGEKILPAVRKYTAEP
ncbi:MAG: LLM class flavin-dependent oxidoreductase [Sporolactobacillus sp.]|jgi:alkanesulfonate monooxygenase SsuD/methylene tetrahydromethanopterin reductase-like flavin-dependent oxidoreductase (luciferase family)|nr:LLM class flavin-dependent oxidoreductase [Sporolactobacillus sp.]